MTDDTRSGTQPHAPPRLPEALQGPSAEEQRVVTDRHRREHKQRSASFSKTFNDSSKAWSIAIDFGASVVASVAIGFFFDYVFGTKPWGLVGWAVLGLLSGFVRFVRQALRANREQAAKMEGRSFRTYRADTDAQGCAEHAE